MSDLIFPSTPMFQSELPLWLNFGSLPWSDAKLGLKSPPSQSIGGSNKISVPMPSNLLTKNKIGYSNNFSEIMTLFNLPAGSDVSKMKFFGVDKHTVLDNGTLNTTNSPEYNRVIALAETISLLGSNYLAVDMMDQVFIKGMGRVFQYSLVLKCKSVEDSAIAGKICNAFSTRLWPTIGIGGYGQSTQGNSQRYGTARLGHPDGWVIWISKQPAKSNPIPEWQDGNGPHISVLIDSQTERIGGNEAQYALSAISNETPLPIIYRITLFFAEIEPTIRSSKVDVDFTISRSQAFHRNFQSGTAVPIA